VRFGAFQEYVEMKKTLQASVRHIVKHQNVQRVRFWMILQIYRLYSWAKIQSARQSVSLKKKCLSLLDAEIRLGQEGLLQLGENEEMDLVVEFVSRQLTKRPHLDALDDAIQNNSQLAADILNAVRENKDVQWAVKTYFSADAYFASLLNDSGRVEESLKEARLVDPEIAAFDQSAIASQLKIAHRRILEVRQILAERSALKIDVTLSELSTLLGLVSAVFLISGYLYTHYFYSLFKVDISLFFTVSDYLAASIERIKYAAIAAGVGLFSLMLHLRSMSMESRAQLKTTRTRRLREVKFFRALGIAALLAAIAGAYFGRPDYGMMRLAVAILAGWSASLFGEKFFKRPLPVTAGAIATLTFIGNVVIDAYQHRDDVLKNARSSALAARVHLKSKIFEGQEKSALIGANGNYIFLLDPHSNAIHAVPRDKVDSIEWRF
jgi:hypothetical protein